MALVYANHENCNIFDYIFNICNIGRYEIEGLPTEERTRFVSQSEWLRRSVVVDVLNFTLGNITLSSIEKLSGVELLCLFTGFPPDEVLRYTGEFDFNDKTYALKFLRAYIGEKEVIYESLKNKGPTYIRSTWWNQKIESGEPMAAQVEHRKIRSLEMIESIIKDGLYKCRQEASETSIFSCCRERQYQILSRGIEDLKKDRIFLQKLLIEVTDPYYQGGL